MKLLWVKTAGLFPPDTGGKIRSYNILRELARRHSVTLFTFYAAHENDLNPELKKVFDRVECMPLDLPKAKTPGELWEYVTRSFSLEPYNISKYCRPAVRKALLELLRSDSYDAMVCDFIFAAGVVPWDWPCPKVVFTHNVESVIWKRHYDTARHPLWKILSWREWQTMRRAERRYLGKADHVLTVSDADRDAFRQFLPEHKVSVVPTGVDSDYFRPVSGVEAPASIVFTGSMDWLPNEDAVMYFVKEILPLIRLRIPEAHLTVVGRYPSQRLRALAERQPALELTGWVDDIRPFLSRSAVCVVPLRIGGGTRIKIFEAMAMGKALVSTSVGAEGLPVTNGENIVLADEPSAFATAVIALLNDSSYRLRLGKSARDFVSHSYSWPNAARTIAGVLETVRAQAGHRYEPFTIPSAQSQI